jgi:hypothetical protein
MLETEARLWAELGEVDPRRRLLLVPVGGFDRRATMPVEFSWRIAAADRRALHVAEDEDALWRLGESWMASPLCPTVPLHMVEYNGSVAQTIGRVVEYELASGFEQVVVVLGRVAFTRGMGGLPRVTRLLHDRTADRIGATVAAIPGALAAVMNVVTR